MTTLNLATLQECLVRAAQDDKAQPIHARAFAAWIRYSRAATDLTLRSLAVEASAAVGAARQTVHVAALGYAAFDEAAFVPAFGDALTWLCQRQYFVGGRPPSFEVDGLGLLGVAIGIRALAPESRDTGLQWLVALLRQSLNLQQQTDWNSSLVAAALSLAANDSSETLAQRITADLRVALASRGLMRSDAPTQELAWDIISGSFSGLHEMTHAATQLAALSYLLRNTAVLRFSAPSVDDAGRVLQGISRSLRRWPWEERPKTANSRAARWDVENEYHVQDLLWAILAPIFPDLDDEEWLKSLGQHHPRADLAIPSLQLIIEVKFLRPSPRSLSNLIKEIAADAGTYLQTDSDYRSIIAFVWDDAARTEEHDELKQGLLKIKGVADAIVVSRPAKMRRSTL